jgi:hypothetical protein
VTIRKRGSEKASESAGTEESVDLVRWLTRKEDPSEKKRRGDVAVFLQNHVFDGLVNLYPGCGTPSLSHFSSGDFLQVAKRCTKLGIEIFGVEIFTTELELLAVEYPGGADLESWCADLFARYRDEGELSISASYGVPDAVLHARPRS